jgi:hypothetical protein
LTPSSDGVRDLLGGDLFGIRDLNLSVVVCSGGVTEGVGTAGGVLEKGDLDGDLDGTPAVLPNTGVALSEGGSDISGGDAKGSAILLKVLTALIALTCVDSGEGIRSMVWDWSLEGADS